VHLLLWQRVILPSPASVAVAADTAAADDDEQRQSERVEADFMSCNKSYGKSTQYFTMS